MRDCCMKNYGKWKITVENTLMFMEKSIGYGLSFLYIVLSMLILKEYKV